MIVKTSRRFVKRNHENQKTFPKAIYNFDLCARPSVLTAKENTPTLVSIFTKFIWRPKTSCVISVAWHSTTTATWRNTSRLFMQCSIRWQLKLIILSHKLIIVSVWLFGSSSKCFVKCMTSTSPCSWWAQCTRAATWTPWWWTPSPGTPPSTTSPGGSTPASGQPGILFHQSSNFDSI